MDLTAKLNKLIKSARSEWPTPVALRMKLLLSERTSEKVLGLLGFLDSIAAFLGSIIISIYVNDPEKKLDSEMFNKSIVDNFFRKHATLGEWICFLREGLNYFQKDNNFFIPELKEFAGGKKDPLQIERKKIKIVKKSNSDKDPGLLDDLNTFRLGSAHSEKRFLYFKRHNIEYEINENLIKTYEQIFPEVEANLYRLLDGLEFLSDYWLFYVKNLDKEEERYIANIYLYSSDTPCRDELDMTGVIKELTGEEDFEPDIYWTKLFLSKVRKEKGEITAAERLLEINPVIINWIKEGEYLPFRFLEWKDSKKKQVYMGEIINQSGIDEINHYETRERLYSIYEELKNRGGISEGKEKKAEIKEPARLSRSHSKQRYDIVRKEIYPNLNIAEEILAGIIIQDRKDEIIDLHVNLSSRSDGKSKETFSLSLRQIIELLRCNPEMWNCVLLGEGGMGKTTSLLKLWESLLDGNENSPVPIFLRLEGYNYIKPERRRDFIWYMIAQEYQGLVPTDEQIKWFENQFNRRINVSGQEYPSIILLLDGLNEVIADTEDLLLCLNDVRKLKGVQIIISSRYDMRSNLNWTEFDALTLEPLDNEQIEDFISRYNIKLPEDMAILRNPMMLTLYCGLEREMKLSVGKRDYDFILEPRYKAEILHDFIVSSIARLDRQTISEEEKIINRLYMRHLLPRTGFEMEKRGYFEISPGELRSIIKEEFKKYKTDTFLDLYPEIDNQLKRIKDLIDETDRLMVTNAIDKLRKNYCMLKGSDGGPYSFLHQDFRDYFASVYIRAGIEEGIKMGDNSFPELAERVFDIYLRNMLGELTGEPRRRPKAEYTYQRGELAETILDRALGLLKKERIPEGDYRLLNILEILKGKRVDLSDTDLSYLDLRHIILNNVILGHIIENVKISGVDLTGCIVNGENFFLHGHSDYITSINYSPDGKKIASGSRDKTIKEWDVNTGECIRTYKGHSEEVCSISYSPDGKKIASGSRDKTIKEWGIDNGNCIRTYKGHSHWITSISYNADGKKIISGSRDGTIKEWDVNNGKCIKTYS